MQSDAEDFGKKYVFVLSVAKPNNMKQATVKRPSGTYLIIEHPCSASEILAEYGNNWQLLGADPTALTEVEAGEIVDTVSGWSKVIYENYNAGGRDYRDIVEAAFDTALASLSSLAASLGIEKPFVVLKNIEK